MILISSWFKMTATVRTTLNLDKNVLKNIKIIAIHKETTQTKIINDYLKECVEKEHIKEISDNLKKVNPNGLKEMVGVVKTKKPTNAVELKRKAQLGE